MNEIELYSNETYLNYTSICIFIYPHFKASFFTNMSQTREYVSTFEPRNFSRKKKQLWFWFVMAHTHLHINVTAKKSITSDKKRRLTFIEWYHSVIYGLLEAHFKIRRIDIDIKIEKENMSEWTMVIESISMKDAKLFMQKCLGWALIGLISVANLRTVKGIIPSRWLSTLWILCRFYILVQNELEPET